jgi:hypothetical protein
MHGERERTNAYRILVRKPKQDRPLERPRRRWGIILEWILKSGWGGTDRWRALVNTVVTLRGSIGYLKILEKLK